MKKRVISSVLIFIMVVVSLINVGTYEVHASTVSDYIEAYKVGDHFTINTTLACKAEPHISSERYDWLPLGTEITCLEIILDSKDQYYWCKYYWNDYSVCYSAIGKKDGSKIFMNPDNRELREALSDLEQMEEYSGMFGNFANKYVNGSKKEKDFSSLAAGISSYYRLASSVIMLSTVKSEADALEMKRIIQSVDSYSNYISSLDNFKVCKSCADDYKVLYDVVHKYKSLTEYSNIVYDNTFHYNFDTSGLEKFCETTYNDGQGKCATYVSRCLISCGLPENIKHSLVEDLTNYLVENDYCEPLEKVTDSTTFVVGDVIVYISSNNVQRHVVIVSSVEDGKAYVSGHNKAAFNNQLVTSYFDSAINDTVNAYILKMKH